MQHVLKRCTVCGITRREAANEMLKTFFDSRGNAPPDKCTGQLGCMLRTEGVPTSQNTWSRCEANIKRCEWSRQVTE